MAIPLNYQLRNTKVGRLVFLGLLIALSSVIQIIENIFIPTTLPFRPGIANVVTMLIIVLFGPGEGVTAAAARAVLASLATGKFLTIPFFMSLSGGILSAMAMALLYDRFKELSIVGVSIIGATVHNGVQLLIIYFLLITNSGIFSLIPYLWLTALVTGFLSGMGVTYVLKIPLFNIFKNRSKDEAATAS